MLTLDHVEPADSGSDMHSSPGRNFFRDLETRGFHGLVGRGQGQVDEPPHLLQFFFLDEIQRIEVLYFGCDLASELRGVEMSNPGDPAPAREQVSPNLFGGVAHPADQANASNYDPSRQLLPTFRVLADVVDCILYGADFLGILVGNLDLKGFFES